MNANHPCFNPAAHGAFARAHLPVAPQCNAACGYCDRRYSCVNESRPGVTAKVLSPEDACTAAERAAAEGALPLGVVGIAGPGDPLANAVQTFAALRLVRARLPEVLLCVSTNGLALPEYADALLDAGVRHVTVTVNAVNTSIGAQVYAHVRHQGQTLRGVDAAATLLRAQEQGIRALHAGGATIKVNTVIIPGINDAHAADIAATVCQWGADMMNCIAMIPVAGTLLAHCGAPTAERMREVRQEAERFIPQMRHCTRCRADACGKLGGKGSLLDWLPATARATLGATGTDTDRPAPSLQ